MDDTDIYVINNGSTWTLQAQSVRAADFLGLDSLGDSEFDAADAKALCDKAKANGLNVKTDF
jgi:hypothetical protein